MAQIKSALEIALERTADVKGDATKASEFDARQRGKKLANDFLNEGKSFEAELKGPDADAVKRGILDILKPQISLPYNKEDMTKLEKTGQALEITLGNARFSQIYQQFLQACSQYIAQVKQYGDAMIRQFEPKLRAKEEALAAQFGASIHLDPMQDPDFMAAYNKTMGEIRRQYEPMQEQVRQIVNQLAA
jgi:hypothetical protein